MAFVDVDDTNSLFNYKDNAWSAGGITGEFHSTHHSTSMAGAQVIFGPFTGSSISVYSTVGTSQPKIHFQVDGGSQNVDLPAVSQSNVQLQSQLYSASNLDPTQQHTLQINVLDAGPFTLDFVQIGTTGSGVTTTSNPPPPISTPTATTSTTSSPFTSPATSTSTSTSTSTIVSTRSTESSTFTTRTTSVTFPSSKPSETPSTAPSQTTTAGPTMSNNPSSSPLSSSSSPSGTPGTALGGAGTNVDGAVIGSVTGAILFLALVVVGLVLYLRRRRFQQRRPSHTKEFGEDWLSTHPKRRRKLPSLRLNLSGPASSQKLVSPFLPTHISNPSGSTNASTVPPAAPQRTPPTHSFLEQDPADSPVFDIKERPISGATMATRVTVGTNVSQRASVPEFVYEYPFREPAVPGPALVGLGRRSAQAAPTFTLPPLKDYSNLANSPSTTTGTVSPGDTWPDATAFGFVSRNPTSSSASSYYSPAQTYQIPRSPSAQEVRPAATSVNPTYAVPQSFTPDEKAVGSNYASNLSTSGGQAVMDYRRMDATYRPTSFDQSVEAVLHQDAGITLESSLGKRRIDLPPQYSTIGFHQ